MTITSVQWSDADHTAYIVTNDGVVSTVPHDERLAVCRDVIAWAGRDGNAIIAATVPIKAIQSVPDQVSNYQARTVLIRQGLFAKVDAALRSADQSVQANQIALQAWDYANNFYRSSDFVSSMGATLKLSQSDIDNLFIAAAAVQ